MEVYLEDRVVEVNENSLRKAQAAWRGALVRQKMKSLHQNYEDIFSEIEDSTHADPWLSGYLKNMKPNVTILCKRPQKTYQTIELESQCTVDIVETDSSVTKLHDEQDIGKESNEQSDVLQQSSAENSEYSNEVTKDNSQESDMHVPLHTSESSPMKSGPDGSRTANETSVWDSVDVTKDGDVDQERQQIVMELLWVQQAINSRKQYLRLKNEIS